MQIFYEEKSQRGIRRTFNLKFLENLRKMSQVVRCTEVTKDRFEIVSDMKTVTYFVRKNGGNSFRS